MTDYLGFDPDNDEIINRETIAHQEPITQRSLARRISLQALYEIDLSDHETSSVLKNLLTHSPENEAVKGYVTRLIHGVLDHLEIIDKVLQEYAPEWPIQQVAFVDRNILRIALYEIMLDKKTPLSVAIKEALQLANLYGAENTPRFINGVLGSISDNLEEVQKLFSTE